MKCMCNAEISRFVIGRCGSCGLYLVTLHTYIEAPLAPVCTVEVHRVYSLSEQPPSKMPGPNKYLQTKNFPPEKR